MSENSTIQRGGVGIGTVITVVLFILKVTGNIAISWFWVFFPVLLPIFIIVIVLVIIALATLTIM